MGTGASGYLTGNDDNSPDPPEVLQPTNRSETDGTDLPNEGT